MHYVFLVNPVANMKVAAEVETAIFALRKSLGEASVFLHRLEFIGQGGVLAKEYAGRFGSEVVVFACGGDGTANEIANVLAFSDTPMGLIPMGTGNDFVRSFLPESLRKNQAELIRRLDSIVFRDVDLFEVETYASSDASEPEMKRLAMNIVSFGLDNAIQQSAKKMVAATKKLPWLRKHTYNLATVLCVIKGWDYSMVYSLVDADSGGKIEGEVDFILSAICNGSFYGGGFCPAPSAELDDGVLNVCLVEDMPLRKVIPMVGKYKRGVHLPHPNIRDFRVTSGVLRPVGKMQAMVGNYDGENFSGYEVRFEIRPKALKLAFFGAEE